MIWAIDENQDSFRAKLRDYVMVDGSFDPIHEGHIDYFKQSAEFRSLVACLIAPEEYTLTKHPVILPVAKRARVLESIRFLDLVIISNMATAQVIELLQPRIFFKGGDWIDKIPREIEDTCAKVNCEIRFGNLPLNSSSRILNQFRKGQ